MSLSEDGLFREIASLFGGFEGRRLPNCTDALLRVGVDSLDDAAVVDIGGVLLTVSTDFVRGEGFNLFRKGILTQRDLGRYLAVANLSDIAAMGVAPAALLVAVRYPAPMARHVLAVLRGVQDACAEHGVVVIGGDSGTYDVPVLCATALGFAPGGRVLRRSDAEPGQRIFVSGQPGLAGTALLYFQQKDSMGLHLSRRNAKILASSWKHPRAEVALAGKLAAVPEVGACQDSSDGLKRTLEQIASASEVQLCIGEAQLPINTLTQVISEQADIDPVSLVLGDSVDFSLVVTATELPPSLMKTSPGASGFVEIGRVNEGAGCTMKTRKGDFRELPGVPWRHQADDITELMLSRGRQRRPR